MTVRVFEDQGAAELNKSAVIGRVTSTGPITLVVESQAASGVSCVVSASNQATGASVRLSTDTLNPAEATAYTGNGSTTDFSGENLNVLPVVPGTVRLTPATSGPDLLDDGEGNLFTDDVDKDAAGTMNYFDGALVLAYPTGKEPDGAIAADYDSQDELLVAGGRRNYRVDNVAQEETIVFKGAANSSDGAFLRTSGVATGI